ncbi:hypothetical protein [Flavobacterium sp. 14A]|uniref:hypothetical protein n=1 Tax=Flavobacterium sp. 14A TaxID=2735896 RepID=UPI001C2CDDAC|nr:hypothetical protein [Flavobacterium sp. 14A]
MRQVLEIIKKVDVQGIAIPFDIEFRTRNKNNNTGGVLKNYKNAKLLIGTKQKGKAFIDAEHFYRKERIRKNPNHFENATRNIELENGRIIKINFRYITKFNDQEVIY